MVKREFVGFAAEKLEDFYDSGWNSYVRGEPLNKFVGKNHHDGWKDCQEAWHKYGEQKQI